MGTGTSRKPVTSRMVVTGVLAAAIFVATYFLHIYTPFNQGYIHPGDAFLYLAACMLPAPYAMAAGAIGEALSDLIASPVYVVPTLIIKSVMALCFTAKSARFLARRNIAGMFLASVLGLFGYFVFESFMFHSVRVAALNAVFGSLQPIVSCILFLILGSAFDRMHLKQRLFRR